MEIIKLGFKQTLKNTIATSVLLLIPVAYWNLLLILIGRTISGSTAFTIALVGALLLLPAIVVGYVVLLYKAVITTNLKTYCNIKPKFKHGLKFFGSLVVVIIGLSVIYWQVVQLALLIPGALLMNMEYATLIEAPKMYLTALDIIILLPLIFVGVIFLASFYSSIKNNERISREMVRIINSTNELEILIRDNWCAILIITALLANPAMSLLVGTILAFIFALILSPFTLIFSTPLLVIVTLTFIRSLGFALWFIIQLSSSVAKRFSPVTLDENCE